MKTKVLLISVVALFMVNAVAWVPQGQESSPMQQQVAAVTLKIKGFLLQRKSMNVSQTGSPFNKTFHETNAQCENYLREMQSFSASRGDLKPAFLRILTPAELAILKQELADVLSKNPCPIGENPPVKAVPESGGIGAMSDQQDKQTKPGNLPPTSSMSAGQGADPQSLRTGLTHASSVAGNQPAITTEDAGEVKGGAKTVYFSKDIQDYEFRLVDPHFNEKTQADIDGIVLQAEHPKPHVVVIRAKIEEDEKGVSLNGVDKGKKTTLKSKIPAVLHLTTPNPNGGIQVVQTTSVQAVSLDEVIFASELPAKPPQIPTQLHFLLDIVRLSSDTGAKGQCSNRAYSQDAQIWQTIIRLYPSTGTPDGVFTYKGGPGIIYLAVFDDFQPTASLPVGARAFDGTITRMLSGELRVTFANRSLSETSDLLKDLSSHGNAVLSRITSSLGKVSVYQVASESVADQNQIENTVFKYLEDHQAVGNNVAKIKNFQGKFVETTTQETSLPLKITPVGTIDVSRLALFSDNLTSLEAAIQQLANLGMGTIAKKKDSAATDTNNPDNSLGESLNTGKRQDGKKEVIVIQDECYQVSIQPNLSGSDFQPAVYFKGHYDYVTPGNSFVFKNYAEGEGSGAAKDFRRLAFSSEGMTLKTPSGKGWVFNGGVLGRFNRTLKTTEVNEWQAGGKFLVQVPFVAFPGASAGANTKPTIDIDAVAASNASAPTQTINFLAHANFTYSYRTGRLTLDLQSNNGWSNQNYFATRTHYSYGLFQLRFNVKDNLDYTAKYECGKKPPDYSKFCGWKSGFDFLTGR